MPQNLEVAAAFREMKLRKLLDLLNKPSVREYLENLPANDQLHAILKLKQMGGNRRLFCELTAAVPKLTPQYLPNKVATAQKLMFSRLQRHANTLLFRGLKSDNISIIFQFMCDKKDPITNKQIIEASKGTKKTKPLI